MSLAIHCRVQGAHRQIVESPLVRIIEATEQLCDGAK